MTEQLESFRHRHCKPIYQRSLSRATKQELKLRNLNRFNRIKSIDPRLSDNISRINSLLGLSSVKSLESGEKNDWFEDVRQIVKQVCLKLRTEIVSASEIKQWSSKKLHDSAQFEDEAPSMELETYLERLVDGLNHWFEETVPQLSSAYAA